MHPLLIHAEVLKDLVRSGSQVKNSTSNKYHVCKILCEHRTQDNLNKECDEDNDLQSYPHASYMSKYDGLIAFSA